MKRNPLLIFLLLLSLVCYEAQAQKPRLFVGQFAKTNEVSVTNVEKVREAVKEALTETMRFELVDANSIASLGGEEAKLLQQESADYILMGNVTALSVKVEKGKSGSTSYTPQLNYSVTLTNVQDMSSLGTKTYKAGGLLGGLTDLKGIFADSEDEAIANVLKKINKHIDKFVKELLPLEGVVILADYEADHKELKRCYIDLGSDHGVKVKDKFMVMKSVQRGGRTVSQRIGELEVREVVDGTMSYCDVKDDGKDILKAIDELMALDEVTQKENPLKIKIKP